MKILASGGFSLRRVLQSALAAVFLCVNGVAGAHSNLQNAMWAQFESSSIRVAVNVSLREISVAQQISLDVQSGSDFDAFTRAVEAHRTYLLAHLQIKADGRVLRGEVLNISKPVEFGDVETTAYQYEMIFPFDGTLPKEVTFYHSMLEEWSYADGVPWNLSYILRTKRADSPETASWLLASRVPTVIETQPSFSRERPEGEAPGAGHAWLGSVLPAVVSAGAAVVLGLLLTRRNRLRTK